MMIETRTCPTRKRCYATFTTARAVLRAVKKRRRPGRRIRSGSIDAPGVGSTT